MAFSPLDGYDDFLRNLKERVHGAQIKAALSVNRELVLLYWEIGQEILARQQQQGWGTKVIERLPLYILFFNIGRRRSGKRS